MYHIFIHASLSGHLGCFCVPAVVNSAAVNTGVRVPFPVMVFLGWMPNSGITGPCGSFTPSFLRNPHIVLHMVVLIYTHTNSAGGFPFLHTFSSSYCCKFFDDGRSDWCEVIPLYSFGSHFFNNEHCWASFNVFISHLYVFLEKCLFRSSTHFLMEFFFFFIELHELLIYFGD